MPLWNSPTSGNVKNKAISFIFDSGASATPLTSSTATAPVVFPWAGTIVSWVIQSQQSGSIVIDVWKLASTTSAIPTVSNTITASALPTLSSNYAASSSTLTGWTTTVAAGDIFIANINSVTTCARVALELVIQTTI